MRQLTLFTAVLAGVLALATFSTPDAPAGEQRSGTARDVRKTAALQPGDDFLLKAIDAKRREVWHWQRLMQKPRTPSADSAERSLDPSYRRWVLRLWAKHARRVRTRAAKPPRKAAWLCIHRHEGPWNDPHPPYYGGLQMDLTFQRLYGRELLRRKGTADRWTPLEQIWVAERAYRSGRGFYPWPNTARSCGLI
ncbi:MAG: hypothetical protein ACRDN6_04220 [Gaiellaceae bacterium]